MKALKILLFALPLSLSAKASDLTNSCQIPYDVPVANSPQVCQFSLTSYSGTVDSSGDTQLFQVGLSCPQQEDVRATVVVFINDEHVASKVVTINAGKDYSSKVYVHVGSSYKGQSYRLIVQ